MPSTSVKLPGTPPPSENEVYGNTIELAMLKLNDAAQRIAAVGQESRRIPRASRLAPLRDVSIDMQRVSAPLGVASGDGKNKANSPDQDVDGKFPDLWPWLQDIDADEGEHDNWTNKTDPLLGRHIPNPKEAARIEEEDMRRAMAEGTIAPPVLKRRPTSNRLRLAFVCLSVLAILALAVDSILVYVALLHSHRNVPVLNSPPSLTLSSNVVTYGQSITLHIRHFYPNANIYLTHDIHVPLQTSLGASLVQADDSGSADVATLINYKDWDSGFHTIEAEDIKTRYSANATLQIAAGRSTPPHLLLKTNQLDFGAGYVGTNTIRPFILSNSGNGAITWSASSDQPWLMLTPNAGIFSNKQTIAIGVERAHLKVGHYEGKITFSSNVGSSESLLVEMTVTALPPNAGPVLSLLPAVLSFSAQDGGIDPDTQVLTVSNPGSQPLSWSLASNTPVDATDQATPSSTVASNANWLSVDKTKGVVSPGEMAAITVSVHSHNLLPGAYLNTLMFNAGQGTLDSSQSVSVSLTIQPVCGLTLSSGGMSFTAVAGQSNPSTQVLNIGATSSCSGTVAWQATSSASWLAITPDSGQLKGATSMATTVSVDTAGLDAGTHMATLSVITPQSTQSVMVTLTLQNPPPPNVPVMGVSTLSLNFNTTQGQPSPPGQPVTITNTGSSPLQWHTAVNMLATNWLHAGPTGGLIPPGQTGQVTVNVFTDGLNPGTYVGQVTLSGAATSNTAAGGSPQTITINLLVLPPCSLLQPSSSALAFQAVQNGANPVAQPVSVGASGNCAWPLGWKATVSPPAPWLNISPTTGSFSASGQSANLIVSPSSANLAPGTYATQVSISAMDDANGQPQGSPQVFSVMLVVQQPCALQLATQSLTFSVGQGQTFPTQILSWKEVGTCTRPMPWSLAQDAGSVSWLTLSSNSGTDTGFGSSAYVSINVSKLTPGSYDGYLTVSVNTNGATVQSGTQTVHVIVTVTGFSLSGTVSTCTTPNCPAPVSLPGATLTLLDSNGKTLGTATADANGKFTFPQATSGSYTISASGKDANGTHYTGALFVNMKGNQDYVPLVLLPG